PSDGGFGSEPMLRDVTQPKRRMVRVAPVHVLNSYKTQVEVRHPQQERDRRAGNVNRRSSGRARCQRSEARSLGTLLQQTTDRAAEEGNRGREWRQYGSQGLQPSPEARKNSALVGGGLENAVQHERLQLAKRENQQKDEHDCTRQGPGRTDFGLPAANLQRAPEPPDEQQQPKHAQHDQSRTEMIGIKRFEKRGAVQAFRIRFEEDCDGR